MPEGDTVWRVARMLDRALAGTVLTSAEFRVPQLAGVDLTGRQVRESVSRGKHLLLRLSDDLTLRSHLRMDGKWRLFRPDERWRGGPGHEIRVVLRTDDVVAVGYHLHELAVVPAEREGELVGHLGPDLLGPDWDPGEALRRLMSERSRPVGAALMDQRNLAGIGNIYRAELLFLRGLWPWRPVGEVMELPRLVDLGRRVLLANRERGPEVTTGDRRPGRQTWVYGRGGQPCRRCGTTIRTGVLGSTELDQRTVYWCPSCQPE